MINIKLTVNGKDYSLEIEEDKRLIDVLREDLRFTGVKEGCSEGECGACSVIMDGRIVNSCLVMAVQANGSSIVTVEGLVKDGELDPVQRAFIEKGATQCGYCTPGFIMAARAFLNRAKDPTREEIREAISGNLCRCTGYNKIVDAIEEAYRYEKGI